jgi:hypothetical protein
MATLNRELEAARQELRNLQLMQMRLWHSGEIVELLHQFECSCRAESS